MSVSLDLIFLGLVVALILVRLYNVLGTKPEKTQIKIVSKQDFEKFYNMIQKEFEMEEKAGEIKPDQSPTDILLKSIPNFDKKDFLAKAAKVFEMVLNAFATRDKQTLQMLISPKLYEKFAQIIDERTQKGIISETDLIKIDEINIQDVKVSSKGLAKIVVGFVSDQINVLKTAEGELLEGDENFVQKIRDVWTFEKDIHSLSPIWLLTSTKKK